MKRILLVGAGNKYGLGGYIHLRLERKPSNNVLRIGRDELYSESASEIIKSFKPDHIVVSTIERNMGRLIDINYVSIERTIASKLQPLHRVANLVKNTKIDSVTVIGGILSRIVVKEYGAISVAVTAMNMMVDYLNTENPNIRFNVIEPWKINGMNKKTQGYAACIDDVVSAIEFIIDTKSLKGIRLHIDNGFSLNSK